MGSPEIDKDGHLLPVTVRADCVEPLTSQS